MGSVRVNAEKRILINQFEVMQETPRSKPGSDVQRTSIGKSKGYSATNSDMNKLAQDKNFMQPDFDRVEDVNDLSELAKKTNLVPPDFDLMEDDPLLPQDEVEVMQDMTR
ncbi:hypothetical protein HAX54_022032 [Datura stramonium]|uniref:Uncharacterized protein n=1 Tax=Datura stramonium TaxID=4076 RepID=A0ABS8UUT9_DATST|nr:hypothetical protein [Datura stramonium]